MQQRQKGYTGLRRMTTVRLEAMTSSVASEERHLLRSSLMKLEREETDNHVVRMALVLTDTDPRQVNVFLVWT